MSTPTTAHWWERIQPVWFRNLIAVVLVIVGVLALVTPLTPGSWLALIGLEMLGLRPKLTEYWHRLYKK